MKMNMKFFSPALTMMIVICSTTVLTSNMLLYQPKEATATEQNKSSDNPTNFLTYQNPIVGLKIQYPFNWDKQENISSSDKNSTLTDLVRFISPFKNSSDTVAERFDIKVDNISNIQPTTLADYANDTITNLGHDFKVIVSDTNATLSGFPAYKFVYTGIGENVDLQAMLLLTIKGDRAFIISYTAEPTIFSYYLPTILKMVNSFEFTK